jgi:lipid-A-disaccharide synthase
MANIRIAVVAGEASGDLLGSHLVTALRARLPNAEFIGIGGPKMIAAGVHSFFPMENLAVRGYVEALKSLPRILSIRRQLKRQLRTLQPQLFIGVDAPDFNLGLERYLRKLGITTVHFASPSIWAWRGGRIHKIKRAVDHMLVLFPFEKALYDQAAIPATYVGHPLADVIPLDIDRQAARDQLKLKSDAAIVALLPGSRQSELALHADLFIQTAQRLHEQLPNIQFLVPLATKETRTLFEKALYRNAAEDMPLVLIFGHAQEAMAAADCVLVASGTATLEAALIKRPMVITYRVPKLTYRMMWKGRYLPYVGLPNVLAGRFVVPELLQDDATPDNLAQAVRNWLDDKRASAALVGEFQRMHLSLRQNTAQRASDAVLALLQARGIC